MPTLRRGLFLFVSGLPRASKTVSCSSTPKIFKNGNFHIRLRAGQTFEYESSVHQQSFAFIANAFCRKAKKPGVATYEAVASQLGLITGKALLVAINY